MKSAEVSGSRDRVVVAANPTPGESLGMERGTPKEDTGIEGLTAIEYKEKMASAHVKKLKQEQQELESRKSEPLKEQTAKDYARR